MNSTETKVILTADDRTRQAFDSVAVNLNRIKGLASGLGLGAAFSTAGIAAFLKTSIDAADRMNDLSDKTGIAVEQLSGLQLAAKIGGTDLESLAGAISKLSVNIGKNGDDFKKLGINTKDPIEALKGLSDIFRDIEDPFKRAAFANQAFGKSWQEIAPLLQLGGERIDELIVKGQKYAGLNDDLAKKAGELNDQLDEFKILTDSIGTRLAANVVPGLNDTAKAMNDLAREGNNALAILRWFAGLGKSFWDLFIPPEDLKAATSADGTIKRLREELSGLEQDKIKLQKSGGGLLNQMLAGGNLEEIDARITVVKNQLAAYEKFKSQLDKPLESKGASPGENPAIQAFINPPKNGGSKSTGKSDAEKAADDVAKLIKSFQDATQPAQDLSDKLQGQLDAFRSLDPNVKNYLQGLIESQKATEDLAKSTEAWAEQERLNRESDERQLAIDEEQAAIEQARIEGLEAQAKALREMLDPSLKLLDVTSEYQALLMEGLITQEEYDAAIKKSAETMDEATKKQKDGVAEMKRAIEGWGNEAADVFLDTDKNFGDLIDSMLEDIARLAFKRNITDPLFSAIDSTISSGGFDLSSIFGGFFANGGTPPLNKISVVGENGPELFVPKSSGTIVPLTKTSGGNSGGTVVNVINNANGTQATATEKNDNGVRVIDVLIEQVKDSIASDINRGNGQIPATMERKYGLNAAVGAMR